ncbi:MAG: hypothetical protein ACRC4O_01970, partial [Giesbergeria sp.]
MAHALGLPTTGLRWYGRLGFLALALAYALLVLACLWTLGAEGDLSLGRNPLANLGKTLAEFAHPSFLDAWF